MRPRLQAVEVARRAGIFQHVRATGGSEAVRPLHLELVPGDGSLVPLPHHPLSCWRASTVLMRKRRMGGGGDAGDEGYAPEQYLGERSTEGGDPESRMIRSRCAFWFAHKGERPPADVVANAD